MIAIESRPASKRFDCALKSGPTSRISCETISKSFVFLELRASSVVGISGMNRPQISKIRPSSQLIRLL